MLLVALVVVVAVVAAVGLLGGGAALGAGNGRRGGSGARATLPAVGLVAVLAPVAVAVAAVALFGARATRGPGDGDEQEASPADGPRPVTPGGAVAPARSRERRAAGREVRVSADEGAPFPDVVPVVDALRDDAVLRVTATGFAPDTTGSVAQCVARRAGVERCRDRFPVRFDGAGAARFQYLVSATAGPRGCGPGAGCAVVVTGDDGRSALVPVVFGAAVPGPGRVTVAPRRGLADGREVRVMVAGFLPGTRLEVVQCASPGHPVSERCGAPGPAVPVTVGPGGRASATFPVRTGAVGAGRHPCRRGASCAVTVTGVDGPVRAPFVPISFSAGRGAAYDPVRLAAGLGTAAVLAALATWLVRSTDWREPTEAATPELDAVADDK